MALRFSTGLRNLWLGSIAEIKGAIVGATLDFVDGEAGEDSITDSDNGFITAGFAPGDILFVQGATTGGNDTGCTGKVITSVAAGAITFATGSVHTEEVGAAGTVVAVSKGFSLADIFRHGILKLYSGSQPATADAAAVGTLLLQVTEASGAFTAGSFANGLRFGTPASAVLGKLSTQVWSGAGEAAAGAAPGTAAASFRLYANATDAGSSSTTLPRIDGSVAVSGGDLNMSSVMIIDGSTYTIDTFNLTMPYQYGA
jgi:hypothetical protein